MAKSRRGRGEGAVFQRSDGLWCARTAKVAGVARTFYGKTKAEALAKMRAFQPGTVDVTQMTVKAYLVSWLEGAAKNKVQAGTLDRYRSCMEAKAYPHIGSIQLAKLAPAHIEKWYADLAAAGESPRGRQMAGVVLGTALRHAVRLKLIPHSPVNDIPKPRPPKKEMKVWTNEQVRAFLAAASSDRLHSLYVLAVSTGMREGELFGLQWQDIDLAAGSLSVQRTLEELRGKFVLKEPKTKGSRRRIDLPRMAVESLFDHKRRLLAEGNAAAVQVFCDSDGGFLRRSNVQRRSFGPLMKAAGLPRIRFHDLRHTAATCLLADGENVKVVSERLGHASIEITLDTYAHVLPTMQAAAVKRIDRMLG